MDPDLAERLHAWHDFYALIGTAAATLIGLIFIAASIAASYMTERHRAGIQAFFTPTVAHFAAVLITCIVVSAPLKARALLAGLLLAIGAAGLVYSLIVWMRMGRRGLTSTIDLSDRFWYALSPVAGHLLIIAAAVMLLRDVLGIEFLAIATVLLLLAGIRNAWDITAWAVTRSSRGPENP
jgi:hypothetical protein